MLLPAPGMAQRDVRRCNELIRAPSDPAVGRRIHEDAAAKRVSGCLPSVMQFAVRADRHLGDDAAVCGVVVDLNRSAPDAAVGRTGDEKVVAALPSDVESVLSKVGEVGSNREEFFVISGVGVH